MTEAETISKQQKTIERLQGKIKKLEKRLLKKKYFEDMDLTQKGVTAQFRAKIDRKDREALED